MVTVSAGDTVKLDPLIVQLRVVVQKGPGDSLEESRERRADKTLR